ncbi:MAG: hypothetical protein ACU0CO_01995 [Shimia sp.]
MSETGGDTDGSLTRTQILEALVALRREAEAAGCAMAAGQMRRAEQALVAEIALDETPLTRTARRLAGPTDGPGSASGVVTPFPGDTSRRR